MQSPQFWDEDSHSPCHGPAQANVAGTANATYDAAEQAIINDTVTAVNAMLAALRSAGIIAAD